MREKELSYLQCGKEMIAGTEHHDGPITLEILAGEGPDR